MKQRRFAACGTSSGYEAHKRRGETPCEPCRAAKAAYLRHYRRIQNGTACAPGLGWPLGKVR